MGYDNPSRRSRAESGAASRRRAAAQFALPAWRQAAESQHPHSAAEFVPNAFLRIDPQGTITFILPHTEFGQGIYTSTAMLMAEELDVGLDQIQIEAGTRLTSTKYKDPLLGDQATGGSASTRADWMRLRQAAATARIMLVAAAAQQWKSIRRPARSCAASSHASGKRAHAHAYGEVAHARRPRLPVPSRTCKLKDPSQVHADRHPRQTAGHAGESERYSGVRHRREGAGHADRHTGDHPGPGRQAGQHR